MKILNKNYNIDNKLNKNIILISDIHYNDHTDLNRLNYILKEIRKHKPDYICIPGDITDKANINDENEFIEWLKKLSKIAKVIISLGNHEFYVNKNKDIYFLNNFLKKFGNTPPCICPHNIKFIFLSFNIFLSHIFNGL